MGLNIDRLPRELLDGATGGLGLTLCPGKQDPFGRTAAHARDLREDLRRLRENLGIDCLVSLITPREFDMLRVPTLRAACVESGMVSLGYLIHDGAIPEDLDGFASLVRDLLRRVRDGEEICVHCKAGLGRAGTVAACVLVAFGHEARVAIAQVRAVRPGAIENELQETFVESFARWSAHPTVPR